MNAKEILEYYKNSDVRKKKLEERFEAINKEINAVEEEQSNLNSCLAYFKLSIHARINMRSYNVHGRNSWKQLIAPVYQYTLYSFIRLKGNGYHFERKMPFEYRVLSGVPFESNRKYRKKIYKRVRGF